MEEMKTAQRAGTVYGGVQEWGSAWRDAREQGGESIMLTADGARLAVLLMHRQTGELSLLSWDTREAGREDPWQPSREGIGETRPAEYRLAQELPDLRWELPSRPKVHGKGVFMYPLGPVRADVAESLLYGLHVMGDEIVRLTLQNGFKRRHIRELVLGRTVDEAMPVIQRFTTTSNVHHTMAMAMAVEEAWNVSVPYQATRTRTLMAELERAYSHLGDLAALAVSTGLPVPQMEYLHLKEMILRVNFSLFGHRYLRGTIVPGGVDMTRWPQDLDPVQSARRVSDILDRAQGIAHGLARTSSFLDRLHGAGRVPADSVAWARPVGPVGRASGLPMDVRQIRPYADYPGVNLRVPIDSRADAYARFRIRVQELDQSLQLVRRILGGWHPEATSPKEARVAIEGPPEHEFGAGLVEAPRGLLGYWVRFEPRTGRIGHIGIATPSERNWTVVPEAVSNHNILQDFPIIDASFSLSVAGWDG